MVATLISRRAPTPTNRAVLYIHGYVDYFFQTHLADFYLARGYDFYAIDLRKHGRSLLSHQTPNFVRSIADYFPEIDEVIRLIREVDGHDTVLVNGHSTGGLIAALWAHRVRGQGLAQGLFLNSPFFDFNEPWIVRRAAAPLLAGFGSVRPYGLVPQGLGGVYGTSLHRSHQGEWEYDLTWKPIEGWPVRAGWVRAVRRAHLRLHAGLAIDVPVLVGCSARSFKGPQFAEAAHHADAVLDVADIVRWSPNLGPHLTLIRIEGGKHDLTLSPEPARERLFLELGTWLDGYLSDRYLENLARAPVRLSQAGRSEGASAPQAADWSEETSG